MKIIHSNAAITEGIANRQHDVCIINPVRMRTTRPSVLHEMLVSMMPDIAEAIKQNEEFYKNKPNRYHSEHVILLRDIPSKGYKVYTILLDKSPEYDNEILSKAVREICQRSLPQTTYRLLNKSDVVESMVWTWTKALVKAYANELSTMELYEGANNEGINYCEKCVHKNVCKYLAIGGGKPQCEDFLSM